MRLTRSIMFIRELARKHLPSLTSSTPILALSVHPGAVATEQQKSAGEAGAYGFAGKMLEAAANVLYMSKEQGSESAVWAGTSTAVAERREQVQGRYFTEADGKVSLPLVSYICQADDWRRSGRRQVRRRMKNLLGSCGISASKSSKIESATTSRCRTVQQEIHVPIHALVATLRRGIYAVYIRTHLPYIPYILNPLRLYRDSWPSAGHISEAGPCTGI